MNKHKYLKPCPFCGGSARISTDPEAIKDTQDRLWAYTVVCDKCCATSGLAYSTKQATEAWNRRTVEETTALMIPEGVDMKEFYSPEVLLARPAIRRYMAGTAHGCQDCINGTPIYPEKECCHNCYNAGSDCKVTHKCGLDCPAWRPKDSDTPTYTPPPMPEIKTRQKTKGDWIMCPNCTGNMYREGDGWKCCACGLVKDVRGQFRFPDPKPAKSLTNGDRIRAMSDEDFSKYLGRNTLCDRIQNEDPHFCDKRAICRDCQVEWLRQPAGEVEK